MLKSVGNGVDVRLRPCEARQPGLIHCGPTGLARLVRYPRLMIEKLLS